MCLFEIYGQMWVCQIPGLAPLKGFFFFPLACRYSPFSGCCQCPSHWLLGRGGSCYISFQLSTAFIVGGLLRMAILTSVIGFLAILIDFSPIIIRNTEHVVLWPFRDYFSSLNCVRKMYLLQLASWKSCLEFISPIPTPGPSLRAAVISNLTELVCWSCQ